MCVSGSNFSKREGSDVSLALSLYSASVKLCDMDRAIILREDLYRMTERVNEKLVQWDIYWDLLAMLIVVWIMGFICGIGCTLKVWPTVHRPRCLCRCDCNHRPGKGGRRLCKNCGRLVGPGCCWLGHDIGKCHLCENGYEPDPEPREKKLRSDTRSLGTQSQTTYKRKWMKPRFYVLPEVADGVFVD